MNPEWDAQGYETDEEEDVEDVEEEEVFGWEGEEEVQGAVVSLPVHRTRREWLIRRRWKAFRISHRHGDEISREYTPSGTQPMVNGNQKPSSEVAVEDLPKVSQPSVSNGLDNPSSPRSAPSKDASSKRTNVHQKIHKRRVGHAPRRRHGSETRVQRRCDGNHESDLLSETNASDYGVAKQRRRGLSDSGKSDKFESCLEELGWASEDMLTALEDNDLLGMDSSGYFTCREELERFAIGSSGSIADKMASLNLQNLVVHNADPSLGVSAPGKELQMMLKGPSETALCKSTSGSFTSCNKSLPTMVVGNHDLFAGGDRTRRVCKYTRGLESLVMNQLDPLQGSYASVNTNEDLEKKTLSCFDSSEGNEASGVVAKCSRNLQDDVFAKEDLFDTTKGLGFEVRPRRRRSSAPEGTHVLLEALREYSVSWDETELLEDRVTVRRVSTSVKDGKEVEEDLQVEISKGFMSTEDLHRWGSQERLEVCIKRSASVSEGKDLKEKARSARQFVQEQLKATVYVRKGGMKEFGGGRAVYSKDSWSRRASSNRPEGRASRKLRKDSETSGFNSDFLLMPSEVSVDESDWLGDEVSWAILNSRETSSGRDADGLQQDAEPPRATGAADTADGRPPEGVEVEDVGSPDRESEQVARTHSDAQIPVGNDSPVKLVSQDSGIDTRESIEVPRMFPEYFSCLTQATSTPRRCIALVNDYGDVSEDIGLDKLCGMVTRAEDDLTPQCELSGGTFCNYQLDGEFGDVSEDLGIDRFAQGRAQGPAAFSGNSADSGMFVLDDPYIYDEDYVTCNEDEEFALNDELMMEVLCANRVNQMTRTYDDVEAMRRLLEEKEKDLELTARIGKELLERNQELKAQVQSLQAENRSAHESNTQLKHELHQKTQILHALTSDEDGSVVEVPSPVESAGKALPGPILGPIGVGEGKMSARESVARLKRKVDQLEQENKSLRQEATQLASETQLAEETEAILVEGVAQQLASVVDEKRLLENEVERMRGEERRMREEMELLLERLAEAHKEIERLREENALLSGKIQITTDTQDRLAMELADFKEQYQEVSCLLSEAQENLRKVRQKSLPSALTGAHYLSLPITRHGYYGNHPGDSIASELEISMISEMSLDSGIHMPEAQGRIPHYRKVFETYRSASRTSNSPSPSPLHRMPSASSLQGPSSFAQLSTASTLSASSMNTCRVSAKPSTTSTPSAPTRGSSYSNEVPKHLYGNLQSSFYTLDSAGQSEESDHSGMATDNEDCLYPGASHSRGKTRDGVPGSPGAKELQAALTRLDRERQPQLTKGEKAIGGYEGKTRGSSVDVGPHRWSLSSSSASVCQALPYGCRTPDSIMSTGSSRGSRSSWKMPERLMIMKIREGSQFLDEWSRLATPSLSAALEERPGVKVRGRMTDGVQHHNLMDFEEDDDEAKSVSSAPIHPGKFFQSTNSVYTYTNSTVLHPDNTPIVPPSSLPQSPAPSSPSQQPTPLLSRRSSVSAATPTFSTALGLAKMLHERGISASSSDNDQSKGHFTSATVTPCNSPDDGSPFSSRSPSPEDANPIASLISSGAELLRRSLGGAQKGAGSSGRGARAGRRTNRPPIGSLSRSDRKALAGMKLVEKLERIGLESLMQYSQPVRANQGLVPLTTTLQVGSMYARPMAKSPMAQLTSLKSTLRSRSREEPEETDGPSPAKQKPKPCRRQDLGTVPTSVRKNAQDASSLQSHTARGTISAIFFGRKGGLM